MTKKTYVTFIMAIIFTLVLAVFSLRSISITGRFAEDSPPFEVDQILIKILIKTNESLTKEVNVMNTGEEGEPIFISYSGLEGILSLSDQTLALRPGETKSIQINFSSFDEKKNIEYEPGVYVGNLIFRSDHYTKEIPFIIEIESKSLSFDINLNVPVEYNRVKRGTDMEIEVKVFNLEGMGPTDVKMYYSLKDMNENTVFIEDESIVVRRQASIMKTVHILDDIDPGDYVFVSKVEHETSIGTSSYLFEVIEKEKREWYGVPYIPAVLLMVFLAVLVLLFAYKKIIFYRESRKEAKAREIPEDLSELRERIEAISRSINELRSENVDTLALEMELHMARERLEKGMIRMAKEYLSSLESKLRLMRWNNQKR